MLSLYFNFLCVILLTFYVHYCTPTHEHPGSVGQSVAGDEQDEYTNSTYHHESESAHVSSSEDNGVHKSKRSTQQDFLSCCSEVQPRLLDGYYYKFDLPTSRQFSNHIDIVSAGYAYLLSFESNVLKKPHRYFDVNDFQNKSGIVFPPTLPLVCYDTAYTLHESPLFNYGKEDVLRDLNSAEGASRSQPPTSSSATRVSATRHLNPNNAYMVQRRIMYRELGNLLQNLQRGQKETLKTKCSETIFTKTTDSIIELLGDNTIQAMSPDYSLEQFNEVAQLFLGDIVAYEMIRQACKAVCITVRFPEITTAEWTPVAEKLRDASNAVRHNWRETQLQREIDRERGQHKLNFRPRYESEFVEPFSNELMEKYYGYGFRVSIHSGWTADEAQSICDGAQTLKCFDISNAMILIRWKSLKPYERAASFDLPLQHRKFPIVRPPAPSYQFSALYAKVNAALNKVQNAVNCLRVTHLQNRFYKQASDLVRALNNGTSPDIYPETAEQFARSLDALNVFRIEFQNLINIFSEVAMHTGETGIDKVWVLIDRCFFEMEFYMGDIEEHIMQLRQQVVDHDFFFNSVVNQLLLANHSEELRNMRNAFRHYRLYGRYTEQGNYLGTIEVVTKFTGSCNPVKGGIDNIRRSLVSREISEAIQRMGIMGPFYFYILYSVISYDVAYLAIYNLFCASQRYRLISARNLVEPQTRMSIPDIQLFLSSSIKDEMDISDALNEATEAISKQVYKGKFDWTFLVSRVVGQEGSVSPSDSEAERLANKWNGVFKGLSFSVVFVKGDWTGHTTIIGEKMFYNKFFVSPDYSLVRSGYAAGSTLIVNWAPKKRSSEIQTNAARFGFRVGSDQLCDFPSSSSTFNLKKYENIKSFFIWRNYIGHGPHRGPHINNHDGIERTLVDIPCYYRGGASFGTVLDERVCWYRHTEYHSSKCHGRGDNTCHRDDKVAIYALGNVGEDY